MFGSRPPDLDLRVRIQWALDLILRVGFRSDGRGEKGRVRRRRWVTGALLCGGASPGLAFPAFLGSFWATGWCKGTRVACVTHWGVKPGLGWSRAWSS